MAAPTSVALCEFSCNGVCDKLQMKVSPILSSWVLFCVSIWVQNLGDKDTANVDHCISRVNEHAFTGPANNLIKACAAGGYEWINHRFEIFFSRNIVDVVYLR